MRLFSVLAVLFLAGCGNAAMATDPLVRASEWIGDKANQARGYFDERNVTSEDIGQGFVDAKDEVGEQANFVRQHLSDRNVSSEGVADGYVDAKDETGEQANLARQHLSDRNISSEDFGQGASDAREDAMNQGSEAQDHLGKKANEAREYTYTRGLQEMRHGDQATQDDIAEGDDRLSKLEARMALVESVNKAQDELLSWLTTRIDFTDSILASTDARLSAADESILEALEALRSDSSDADAALSAAIAALSSSTDASLLGLASQLAALGSDTDAAIALLQANLDAAVAAQAAVDASQDLTLSSLQSGLSAAQSSISSLSSSVTGLQFAGLIIAGNIAALHAKDFLLTSQINGLSSRITAAEGDIDDLESSVSTLQSSVSSLQSGFASVQGDITALEAALEAIEASEYPGDGTVHCTNSVAEIDNPGSSNDYCRITFSCNRTTGAPVVTFSQVKLDKSACD